jgi:DNA polymerase-3 subunit beta
MRFSLLQENLIRAISVTGRVISSTPQLPVLGNIFIKTQGQAAIFVGTNLETTVFFQVPAKVEEPGEITVPAKTMTEFVGTLEAGKVVLEDKNNQLQVVSQHGRASFATLPSKDFPAKEMPQPQKKGKTSLVLSAGQLLGGGRKVVFAAAADETRPVLAGALFQFEKAKLRLVATDGYRLSLVTLSQSAGEERPPMIVPASALRELERGIKGEEAVRLFFDEEGRQVYFSQGNMVVGSRLIEGDFPDYQRILPKDARTRAEVDRESLIQAVKAAATFAKESANIVKMTLGPKQVRLSASAAQSGEGEVRLPQATITGEDTEIAFNYRFLLEALAAFEGERITIEASGGLAPAKFTDPKDPGFVHIIMPVRLQG